VCGSAVAVAGPPAGTLESSRQQASFGFKGTSGSGVVQHTLARAPQGMSSHTHSLSHTHTTHTGTRPSRYVLSLSVSLVLSTCDRDVTRDTVDV
jgi:hypothetical protein